MELLIIVFAPLVGSVVPALAGRVTRLLSAWAAGLVTAVALAYLLWCAPAVFAGQTLSVRWPWVGPLELAFRLDGLGLLFALLILGIGLLIILYARYYLAARDPLGRFYMMLLLFMGSMLGVVLADNLLLLVVFWELTSLTSFLLIGYTGTEEARTNAFRALAIASGAFSSIP